MNVLKKKPESNPPPPCLNQWSGCFSGSVIKVSSFVSPPLSDDVINLRPLLQMTSEYDIICCMSFARPSLNTFKISKYEQKGDVQRIDLLKQNSTILKHELRKL